MYASRSRRMTLSERNSRLRTRSGLVLAVVLVEQLLELAEQLGRSAREAFAPVADAGVGDGEQAHEDVRAADAVPAGVAGQPQGFPEHLHGGVAQPVQVAAGRRGGKGRPRVRRGLPWKRVLGVLTKGTASDYGRAALATQAANRTIPFAPHCLVRGPCYFALST